jgi:putative phosphonate metabolism protein
MMRYALYWAPDAGSALAALGAAWLGRDVEGRAVPARPALDGFDPARLETLTAEPRRYGLHATLKAPFAPAAGADIAALRLALADFASGTAAVELPLLELRHLDRFLALVPSLPCPPLDELAARCVVEFDRFRRAPGEVELARRRSAGLDAVGEAHLERWGYPYVLDRFRFHVTLTGPLEAAEAGRLMPPLAGLFAPAIRAPLRLDTIALFEQAEAGTPFVLLERCALRRQSS